METSLFTLMWNVPTYVLIGGGMLECVDAIMGDNSLLFDPAVLVVATCIVLLSERDEV